jgi:hypothetical protein
VCLTCYASGMIGRSQIVPVDDTLSFGLLSNTLFLKPSMILHQFVNVILLARDTPKLEDPVVHLVAKNPESGMLRSPHQSPVWRIYRRWACIAPDRTSSRTFRRFGMQEDAFGAAVGFAEDASSRSASNAFQSAWTVPPGIRNENPITRDWGYIAVICLIKSLRII